VRILDAAGEGAGAPAVPNPVLTSQLRDPATLDAAGEGAGAPAVPNPVLTSQLRHLATRRAAPLLITACATVILAACSDDTAVSPTTPPPVVTTTTEPARVEDGILRIGVLLPESGEGATIGQPLRAAAETAIARVNEAGGVLGRSVEWVAVDEGNSPATARDGIAVLLEEQVDAIIGPASSTITLATLDALLSAGVLTCSPTATALALDDFPNSELFFRTAPSDSLQARAIAELAEQTGARAGVVTYVDDTYGRPLADATIGALQSSGLDVQRLPFAAFDESLLDDAAEITDSGAGVIVVIADADQGTRMLSALGEQAGRFAGVEPDIIINDAIRNPPSPQLVEDLPPEVRTRIRGVSPQAMATSPAEPLGFFATNAYDCVNLIALAAAQAGVDEPAAIAEQMDEVSTGGQPCREFNACVQLLTEQREINYEGPGGVVDLGPDGDPTRARFDEFAFNESGVDESIGPRVVPSA
jgi:branched-chain amino acid transport system substrate-binding protein